MSQYVAQFKIVRTTNIIISMQIFLPFHWPSTHHVTCKELSTNNGLLMCNIVSQLCLAAKNILLMHKWNHAFLLLVIALAWKWQSFIKKTKLVNKREDNYWTLLLQFMVIYHCLTDQLFDLLATDKLQYFAQPCPITTHMSNIHVTCNNCTRGNMIRTAMAKQWQLVALLQQG